MKDLEKLEKLLVENGRVITHDDVVKAFSELVSVNNKISKLIKKGWLVSLKRGIYYIAKLGSLGGVSISNYQLANIIGEKSFISFEASLKYHGLFDQGLKRYTSISRKQYHEKRIENITYSYVKVKEELFFGYEQKKIENQLVKIATRERALLDLIEYRRSLYSVSLVIEKIKNYKSEIDFKLLIKYLKKYSQVTIKTIGLILDLLKMDSRKIKLLVNSDNSTSKLLSNSSKFSSTWRIYYNPVLEEQSL
jgi:predicted transcriptional regulator of viral defense system